MAKIIKWNKVALEQLKEISIYLELNYSQKTAIKFEKKILDKLNVLIRYPEIGRASKKHKLVRFVLVDKNIRMYYSIRGQSLRVVYFFDTRQNPKRNKY